MERASLVGSQGLLANAESDGPVPKNRLFTEPGVILLLALNVHGEYGERALNGEIGVLYVRIKVP